jgi:arabinofuranosyltransferase
MSTTRALAGGGLLVGLGIGHSALFRHHVTDDAFISFRYLTNWLAGDGLVYNPGEAVWGFSNFLWIVSLVPGVAIGLEPLTVARSLGLLASVAIAVGVVLSWRGPGRGASNLAGGALLAASGAFWMQGWSGLETSGFTLLAMWTLRLHAATREAGARWTVIAPGVAAALTTLARPEGAGLFALLVLDAWLERRSAANPVPRRLLGLLIGFSQDDVAEA